MGARLEAKARARHATAAESDAPAFRVAAYQLCRHVRAVQDALTGRKVGTVYHFDRAALADPRDAHTRLTELLADLPDPVDQGDPEADGT